MLAQKFGMKMKGGWQAGWDKLQYYHCDYEGEAE